MPTCRSCGRETAEAKFCQFCGSPMEAPGVPPPSPMGTPPPSAPVAQAPPAVVPVTPPPGVAPPPTAPPPGVAPPQTSPPPGMTQQPGMPVAARYPVQRAARSGATTSSGAQIWGGIGIAAMAMAIIGSVLPWARAFIVDISGWEGDGQITFFAGILVIVFFIVGLVAGKRWPFIVCLIGSISIAGVAIYHVADLMNLSSSVVGYGLYLTAAGGLLGLIASIGGIAVRSE